MTLSQGPLRFRWSFSWPAGVGLSDEPSATRPPRRARQPSLHWASPFWGSPWRRWAYPPVPLGLIHSSRDTPSHPPSFCKQIRVPASRAPRDLRSDFCFLPLRSPSSHIAEFHNPEGFFSPRAISPKTLVLRKLNLDVAFR